MPLSDDARDFLRKSQLCFIGIKFQLDCRKKSVEVLKAACNDLWPWLIEFKKLPPILSYQTHCDNLETWLNMLKDTTEHELTEDQINEMTLEFNAAYEALKTILS